MSDYLLVIIATVLFSLQFVFNQAYEKRCGTSLTASLGFNFCSGAAVALLMIIISGARIELSPFSLAMAAISSVVHLLMGYFSLKAFSVANLSVFSVFCMLGGMALPTLAGIVFYSEELTPLKLLCLFLISFSVILGARRGKADRRAYFYYAAIFVLNGLVGVASKIHQSSDLPRVGSVSYMFWVGVMIFLVSGASLIVKDKRLPAPSAVLVVSAGGYGILNGIGNLLLLVALISLPASVQYPLVTGGVMVLSTVISALRREKLSRSELISSAIALAASILIAL